MIELTEQQAEAIANAGETPQVVVDPRTKTAYVLLRKDVYDRLASDDSPWSDEEMDLLRGEAVEALGWEGMEAYRTKSHEGPAQERSF